MRMLHDRRQQAEGQGGAIPGVIGGGGGQQPLNRPHRGAFGKGKLGGGIGAGVVGARALEIEEGGGLLASAASAAGAPEWLNPLVKAELRDFPGTRHCRSRLKKIFVSVLLCFQFEIFFRGGWGGSYIYIIYIYITVRRKEEALTYRAQ